MATQTSTDLSQLLATVHTESGKTLLALTEASPVLVIFLRHFGCAFCRQAISDIADLKEKLAAKNVRPVFVHMGSPALAKPYFDYYHLEAVERVSNPDASLYRHPVFDLSRQHPIMQLFSLQVWKRWLGGTLRKHGVGPLQQDSHQMPGLFFLKDGKIARTFRYKTPGDEPNYLKLVA